MLLKDLLNKASQADVAANGIGLEGTYFPESGKPFCFGAVWDPEQDEAESACDRVMMQWATVPGDDLLGAAITNMLADCFTEDDDEALQVGRAAQVLDASIKRLEAIRAGIGAIAPAHERKPAWPGA